MRPLLKARQRLAARQLHQIARRFEPRVARAFIDAVAMIKNQATLRAIADALAQNDLNRVLALAGEALGAAFTGAGLPPGAVTVQDEIWSAFRAGGTMGMNQLPRAVAIRASLDLTNPAALRFATEYLPTLIREVTEAQRAVVRDAVSRGFAEGRPTVVIARDIRETVGLTQHQAGYVRNFRRQLETKELGNATPPWERRLSATERQSARAEFNADHPSRRRIDQLVERYQESLINRRAKDIARTEVHRASLEGQAEVWHQAVELGILDTSRARRFWLDTGDGRTRPDHAAVPKMNPEGVGIDEPFDTPVGPVMRPGESGVPEFDINCRCAETLEFID